MKTRNCAVLRHALTLFTAVLMLSSQGTVAFASELADDNATSSQEIVSDEAPETIPNTVETGHLISASEKLIDALNSPERYVSSTFNDGYLRELSQRAQALLTEEGVTQEQIDACVSEIVSVLNTLRLRGNKKALQGVILQAEGLKASDYTTESFAGLQTVLQAAQTLLADIDAEQATLDQMVQRVTGAIAALVKEEPKEPEKPQPEKPKPETPAKPEKPKPEKPQPPQKPEGTQKPQKPAESTPGKNEGASDNHGENEQPAASSDTKESSTVETNSGDESVKPIDKDFAVDSLTDSDLNGFVLPLLTSFEDERQAALTAQALETLSLPYEKEPEQQKAGQFPEAFNNLSLPRYLYQSVFDKELGETYEKMKSSGEQRKVTEAGVGDLLFWENNQSIEKVAIYLGQGKYIMADENALKEAQQILPAKEVVESALSGDEEEEPIPGVRIFTIRGYQQDEDGVVTIEATSDNEQDTKDNVLLAAYDQLDNPDYAVHSIGDAKLTEVGRQLLANYAASIDFRVNPVTEAFISSLAEDARQLGLEYKVYASVMIAQAILETGSGGSGLSKAPYHNLFGIKGLYNGNSVSMKTMEDNGTGALFQITSAFRSYPNFKASLNDYVSLVRGGIAGNSEFYKGTWRSEAKNYLQATEYLTGRYATDTSYNNKLNSIIAAYNLTQYDEPLPADNSVIIAGRNEIPADYREKMIFPDYNGVDYNLSGSYPIGQCTWYAFNRIAQLGGKVDNYMGNGGEWGQRGAALGYKTTQTPTVGYVVSFHPGVAGSSPVYGHVAFVEAVGPEGILISEGNVLGGTTISYRIIANSIARSNNVTYIAPK